jgi:stage II sporulation protein E
MYRKINVMVISFFAATTINYHIGFMVFLPVLMFYIIKDTRNLYYVIPPAFLALLLVNPNSLVAYGIMLLVVLAFLFFMRSVSNSLYIYLFFPLVNTLTYFLIYQGTDNLLFFILMNLVSLLLYLYLEFNIVESLKKDSLFYNNSYLEILLIMIAVIGGARLVYYGVNAGLVLALFYAMYLSKSTKDVYSMLYAILVMLIMMFVFRVNEAILIPFISAFYLFPSIYPLLIINVFCSAVIFADLTESMLMIQMIMGLSILFEVFKFFTVKENVDESIVCDNVYTQVVKNVNDEVLNFASFLDKFAKSFKNPKEYNEKISEGIKTLVQGYCSKCRRMKECFGEYKVGIYTFFKDILHKEIVTDDLYKAFSSQCPNIKEIERAGAIIYDKLDLANATATANTLIAQITGVSNALRAYSIDMCNRSEIKYNTFAQFKQRLIDHGYAITYFEVLKTFDDDFMIAVGIKNGDFDMASKDINVICEALFGRKSSTILQKFERNTIYLNVLPELKIDIIYGYGALSSGGNQICGDNYLIKELKNGRFISAISDGMGKGYSAFYESDMTLKLVEDLVQLNLETSTALEILNTFYVIQDYLERYATLDFLEINRYNMTALFYKMGGTTSYIFKENGKIDKIINKNLPFGIEELIDNYEYHIEEGDLILMSSDGIFENVVETDQLENFIRQIRDLPPQKIVYEILNYTVNNKVKTNDDMSLIALKVNLRST